MAHYLIGDAGEEKTQETFGAGWQSAATAENIVSLNEAVERGFTHMSLIVPWRWEMIRC